MLAGTKGTVQAMPLDSQKATGALVGDAPNPKADKAVAINLLKLDKNCT